MIQTNLETLLELLNRLGLHHQKLLEVVEAEKAALANADLSLIQKFTYEKEALVETIKLVESQRIQTTAAIEVDLKADPGTLRVSDIIVSVNERFPREASLLIQSFEHLVDLVGKLSEKNRANRLFIEKSLQYVNQMRGNVLGEAGARTDTYTPKGQKKSGGTGTRLISKEA